MKKLTVIFFLSIFINSSFSQTKIAVIFFNDTHIKLNNKVSIYLTQNQITIDSVKNSLKSFMFTEIENKHAIAKFVELNQSSSFTDTLVKRKTSRFKHKIDTQNNKFIHFIYSEIDPPKTNYYSRKMNAESEQTLSELINNNKYDFVVVLNKFKTKRNHWFSKKTKFQIHLDIFDKNIDNIFGEKIEIERKIFKGLYPSTFNNYLMSLVSNSLKGLKKPN